MFIHSALCPLLSSYSQYVNNNHFSHTIIIIISCFGAEVTIEIHFNCYWCICSYCSRSAFGMQYDIYTRYTIELLT